MEQRSPLEDAVVRNDIERVIKLLEEGADVNKPGANGATPILLSAFQNNMPMVEFLIQHDADVNTTNNKGDTPLHGAAFGSRVLVKTLLDAGANVNRKNKDGETPLDWAFVTGCNQDNAKVLLKAGANADHYDPEMINEIMADPNI